MINACFIIAGAGVVFLLLDWVPLALVCFVLLLFVVDTWLEEKTARAARPASRPSPKPKPRPAPPLSDPPPPPASPARSAEATVFAIEEREREAA